MDNTGLLVAKNKFPVAFDASDANSSEKGYQHMQDTFLTGTSDHCSSWPSSKSYCTIVVISSSNIATQKYVYIGSGVSDKLQSMKFSSRVNPTYISSYLNVNVSFGLSPCTAPGAIFTCVTTLLVELPLAVISVVSISNGALEV